MMGREAAIRAGLVAVVLGFIACGRSDSLLEGGPARVDGTSRDGGGAPAMLSPDAGGAGDDGPAGFGAREGGGAGGRSGEEYGDGTGEGGDAGGANAGAGAAPAEAGSGGMNTATGGAAPAGGASTTGGVNCTLFANPTPDGTTLQALAPLPGDTDSAGNGVSADGRFVVGTSFETEGYRAARWMGGVVTELPVTSGDGSAIASSADGAVVVGRQIPNPVDFPYLGRAVRWVDSEVEALFDADDSSAHAVSADGTVIIGYAKIGSAPNRAFRWEEGHGVDFITLDEFPDWSTSATSVSADGSVIVGALGASSFRWSLESGTEQLPLPAEALYADAYAVSGDGQVIAGMATYEKGEIDEGRGFIYRDGQFEDLGLLPGQSISQPTALSEEGDVVVGQSGEAMIWDRVHGLRALREVLENSCLDVSNFRFQTAWGLSGDGRVIAGDCCPAWVVRLGKHPSEMP